MLPPEYRGYALALGSNLAGAIGSIACVLLIYATSVETTALFWFLGGTVLSFSLLLWFRHGIQPDSMNKNMRVYMEIALIMTVAALAWFLGLKFAGPSNVAFVGQLGIVIGVLLGAFVLGERITFLDGVGGSVAVLGAVAMTYHSGGTVILGMVFTLVNATGWALQTLLVKQHVASIDKLELLFVRSVTATCGVLLFSAFTGGLTWPRTWLLPAGLLASAIGYVAVNLLIYQSLRYADLAKISMLGVVQPPIVMVCAYFVFGAAPTVQELVGGALILVGVSVILAGPMLRAKQLQPASNL
jgi:drug/metabolite transporter (DMT)-like permease